MDELSMLEVEEVSGAIIRKVFYMAYEICNGLYGGGMYFYNTGRGDEYLYAVQGGNMGA